MQTGAADDLRLVGHAFRVLTSGLGGKQFLDPVSFGPDPWGLNKGLAGAEAWRQEGAFANLSGKGTMSFAPLPVTQFVCEADVEFTGGENGITLSVGDPWRASDVSLRWNADRRKVECTLLERSAGARRPPARGTSTSASRCTSGSWGRTGGGRCSRGDAGGDGGQRVADRRGRPLLVRRGGDGGRALVPDPAGGAGRFPGMPVAAAGDGRVRPGGGGGAAREAGGGVVTRVELGARVRRGHDGDGDGVDAAGRVRHGRGPAGGAVRGTCG